MIKSIVATVLMIATVIFWVLGVGWAVFEISTALGWFG
jgi:hypothetical protein